MSRRDIVDSRAATYYMQLHGTELSGTVLAIGQRAASLQRLRPDLSWMESSSLGDLDALVDKGIVFDTVVCIDVLQYEPDPVRMLIAIRNLLSDKGTTYVVAPNFGRDDPRELWGFRPEGLRRLAEAAGLTVAESTGVNSPWGGMVLGYLADFVDGDAARAPLPPEYLDWATRMDAIFTTSAVLIAARSIEP